MLLRSALLGFILPVLVIFPSQAASEIDLQRLQLTGSCSDCDLSGADLSSSHLIGDD